MNPNDDPPFFAVALAARLPSIMEWLSGSPIAREPRSSARRASRRLIEVGLPSHLHAPKHSDVASNGRSLGFRMDLRQVARSRSMKTRDRRSSFRR
jgi:hypothetical protein